MDLRKGIKILKTEEGEIIEVKRTKILGKDLGFRVVHPIKNIDGSLNWVNLLTGGGWGNLIKMILIIAIILFICWAYKHDVKTLTECCQKFYDTQIPKIGLF